MTNKTYNPTIIEAKWSKVWDKQKAFQVDIKNAKKPFYNLAMFPYPSAEGLHMGHIIPYSGCDTYGRYLRMNGFDVFEPMGFDAFGIHSENFALKKGLHPKKLISQTVKYFREKQMKRLGTLFDWDREVNTTDPNYYKWTQWLFIQMFKAGLAEKRKAAVTYCPSCKTVLSDEQTEVIKKSFSVIARTPSEARGTKQSSQPQLNKKIATLPEFTPSKVERVARNDNEISVTVCERCQTPIERKELEQWFFKITKYADRLLSNLNHLSPDAYGHKGLPSEASAKEGINWSEKTKNSQRNWIGKSEGINITYKIDGANKTITCFTTRPETNFGATFIVLAPEHPFVNYLLSLRGASETSDVAISSNNKKIATLPTVARNDGLREISSYVKKAISKSEQERITEGREKTGVFTGFYAINNLNAKKMPIYISDFVVGTVGTGAVVGVPGHDKRDFEFAKKFGLEIVPVVVPHLSDLSNLGHLGDLLPYEGEGFCVNSGFLNGLSTQVAKVKIRDYFEQKGWGKRVVHYKLRDWCISRQRYWGPPIPMIYCEKCSWQPVPETDLPVLLPFIKDYKPTGEGKSPLARLKNWVKVKCPKCGGWVERETDVSDTFLDSAWYFLRYPSVGLSSSVIASPEGAWQSQSSKKIASSPANWRSPRNDKGGLPWNPKVTRKWLPVDMYIGGHEHAVLHLMYSRFVTMALKDMGYIDFEEPFKRFFAHGLLISEGAKMSKSRGNVVNPNIYLDKYGADTLRLYILFLGPYDAGGDFRDKGITGMHKFLKRVWNLVNEVAVKTPRRWPKDSSEVEEFYKPLLIKTHKTIKKVSEDIANLHFNTAIAALMEYYNVLADVAANQNNSDVIPAQAGIHKNNIDSRFPLGHELEAEWRGNDKRLKYAEWQEALKTLLLLLAPFAPFMTEELWQNFEKNSIHSQPWPKFDPSLLEEEEVTIVVQVNGRIRDKIIVSGKDTSDGVRSDTCEVEELKKKIEKLALASPKVQKYLAGQLPKKVIFVPGKLINFVV